MKRLISSSAALLLAVGTASAADLMPYAPPPPPPPPPPMWTGGFVGGAIGGSFGNSGNTISGKDLYCTGAFCPVPLVEQDFMVHGADSNGGSVAGGAQLGYNFQFDPSFVIGGVIDFTALDRSGSSSGEKTFGPIGNVTETDSFTNSFKNDWLTTLRIRLGPTFDNLWIYGTGGLAIGGLNSSASSVTTWTDPYAPWSPAVVASGQGSSSGTAVGYAVGAGAEYKITPNWSIFGEYLYYNLSHSYTVTVATNPNPPLGVSDSKSYGVKANVDGNLIKVGLNYTFLPYWP